MANTGNSELHKVRRLMAELKSVHASMEEDQVPWLLKCDPIENSLLEWTVDMRFPKDSSLQCSLNALSRMMLDESRNMLTFQIRFPPEYPGSPPEIWLRKPRLSYGTGAPVTFGGKVCIPLLTTASWKQQITVPAILQEVQTSLVEAGAEADPTVGIKPYLQPSNMLERTSSVMVPSANDFQVDDIQVISPREAGPFFGDVSRLELTDKIVLSSDLGIKIYSRGDKMDLPIMFEVKTRLGRKAHCGLFDFMTGIPSEMAILPKWVMNDLGIPERETVRIRGVQLELIKTVKLQPHSVDFYEAVRKSQREPASLLRETLTRYSALTEDTSIPVEISGEPYDVHIVALEPNAAVRIIDQNVAQDFEFKVDFEAAPNLEDEEEMAARQDELIARQKARRQQKVDEAAASQEKRAAAIRRKFVHTRDSAKQAAGAHDGKAGDVNVRMRLPGGAQMDLHFRDGAPAMALVALALGSEWAENCCPWGVQLLCNFPKRTLKEEDVITKVMHRSTLSVQEQRAPEADEDVFAAIEVIEGSPASPMITGVEDENMTPVMDEDAMVKQALKMFEVQRFIQTGMARQEALRRVERGDTAPRTPRQSLRAGRLPAFQTPQMPLPCSTVKGDGVPNDFAEQLAAVRSTTGISDAEALQLLEMNNWNSQCAINCFFDSVGHSSGARTPLPKPHSSTADHRNSPARAPPASKSPGATRSKQSTPPSSPSADHRNSPASAPPASKAPGATRWKRSTPHSSPRADTSTSADIPRQASQSTSHSSQREDNPTSAAIPRRASQSTSHAYPRADTPTSAVIPRKTQTSQSTPPSSPRAEASTSAVSHRKVTSLKPPSTANNPMARSPAAVSPNASVSPASPASPGNPMTRSPTRSSFNFKEGKASQAKKPMGVDAYRDQYRKDLDQRKVGQSAPEPAPKAPAARMRRVSSATGLPKPKLPATTAATSPRASNLGQPSISSTRNSSVPPARRPSRTMKF